MHPEDTDPILIEVATFLFFFLNVRDFYFLLVHLDNLIALFLSDNLITFPGKEDKR